MATKQSIAREAYLRILKLATLFTIIIITSLLLISLHFLRASKIKDINRTITQNMNLVFNYELRSNYDLIIKKILKKAQLRDLAIYNKDCKLKAFSSISIAFANCPSDSELEYIKASLGEETLHIFYSPEFSYLQTIKSNISPILIITSVIFIVTTLGLLFFLNASFLTPLDIIKRNIEEGNDKNIPKEFNFITYKLADLKEVISKHEKEKSYVELTRRVVHDIRNPLAFLKMNLSEESPDVAAMRKKINEIDHQVSSLLVNTKKRPTTYPIREFLESVSKDIEYIFNLKVLTSCQEDTSPNINQFDLSNVFLNLARNSKEAGASELRIQCMISDGQLSISFCDNGHGVLEKEKIFQKNYTSKHDGNGIGLSSLKELLAQSGGELAFDPKYTLGAKFVVKVPIFQPLSDNYVFIDDDKYLRSGWVSTAKKAGVQVSTFESVEQFLENSGKFSLETPIYLDSDLGAAQPGQELAEQIFKKGFHNIHLATSFQDIDLSAYPWIKSLCSKEPPFLPA